VTHTQVYNTQRWRDLPRNDTPDSQRFLSKTEPSESGCWLWRNPTKLGYGQFWSGGTNHIAHRWSYQHFVGPIPAGLVILHTCGNSACVNPDHLQTGTHTESRTVRDTCARGHEMNEENSYLSPSGDRYCRKCRALNARDRYRKGNGRPEGWTATRRRILERDFNRCTVGVLFGIEDQCSDIMDVHHRLPRRWGGTNEEDNLYAVCRSHHMRLEGILRRMRKEQEPKKCTHRHRYDHARRECERRMNRL